jgi:type 1 glutamine amidotransferase
MCRKVGIEVVCTKDGRVFDGDIDQYDAFAFYTNNDLTKPNERNTPPMTAAGKQKLLDAVSAGKGFVGFHSTCASWRTPTSRGAEQPVKLDPFLAMLGGEFIAHGDQQEATMRVVSRNFPGCDKIGGAFALHEEWYALTNFADDLHVLLVQETDRMKGGLYQRPPYPATWTRKQGKGRVFYTSMGHREDVWTNEVFQEIVLGGIVWAVGNAEVDVSPNLLQVAPDAATGPRVD